MRVPSRRAGRERRGRRATGAVPRAGGVGEGRVRRGWGFAVARVDADDATGGRLYAWGECARDHVLEEPPTTSSRARDRVLPARLVDAAADAREDQDPSPRVGRTSSSSSTAPVATPRASSDGAGRRARPRPRPRATYTSRAASAPSPPANDTPWPSAKTAPRGRGETTRAANSARRPSVATTQPPNRPRPPPPPNHPRPPPSPRASRSPPAYSSWRRAPARVTASSSTREAPRTPSGGVFTVNSASAMAKTRAPRPASRPSTAYSSRAPPPAPHTPSSSRTTEPPTPSAVTTTDSWVSPRRRARREARRPNPSWSRFAATRTTKSSSRTSVRGARDERASRRPRTCSTACRAGLGTRRLFRRTGRFARGDGTRGASWGRATESIGRRQPRWRFPAGDERRASRADGGTRSWRWWTKTKDENERRVRKKAGRAARRTHRREKRNAPRVVPS